MNDYNTYVNGHKVRNSEEAAAYLLGLHDAADGPDTVMVEAIYLNGEVKNVIKVTFFHNRIRQGFFLDEVDRGPDYGRFYLDTDIKFVLRRLLSGFRNGYINLPR